MHLSDADLAELESQLREAKDSRLKMIVTDGVFSMDGDFAPLKSGHMGKSCREFLSSKQSLPIFVIPLENSVT